MRKLFAPLLGIAIVVALFAMFSPAAAGTTQAQGDQTASVTLTGAEEVPDPGDPDGTGTTTVTFRSASGEICWDIKVSNITLPSVGAHIHEGAKGVAGPVVVPFSPPDANGTASGCTKPDAAIMTRIMQNPANFYVNVHASDFPAGAVRGQLMMAAGGGAAPAPTGLPNTGADSGALLALAGFALFVVAVGFGLRIGTRRGTNSR